MLTGSLVAIVTPMFKDGSIDFASYKNLINFHIDAGSSGIVVAGTTGESATLSNEEYTRLIQKAVEYARGRLSIIAGTGKNNTKEAIALSNCAKAAGAEYGLSVTPYYNRPSQQGLYQHFKAIAESSDLPTILYNVPSRTAADLHNDTILHLAELENIVGLKDATGDLPRVIHLAKYAPKDFALYSGDDGSALPFILTGGHGVISVTANIAPKSVQKLCIAALEGSIAQAKLINEQLESLHRDLFIEPSPAPVKWALYAMGLIQYNAVRLPLLPLTASSIPAVQLALHEAGINS